MTRSAHIKQALNYILAKVFASLNAGARSGYIAVELLGPIMHTPLGEYPPLRVLLVEDEDLISEWIVEVA